MECLYCKAQMKRGTAPFRIDRHGKPISWDAIPTWVCDRCGEPKEVAIIQSALAIPDRQLYY
jgi:YgiT-type zinc finger domain-containing protein